MAAILVKVAALAIKTVAKPFASRFESYVMNHPTFRQHTITAAQKLHRLEIWINRGAEGKTGKVFVADMTEEKSVQLASKLASEGFVFAVGVVIVLFEYNRAQQKEVAKKKKEEMAQQTALAVAAAEREKLAAEQEAAWEQLRSLMHDVERLERLVRRELDEVKARQQAQASSSWTMGGFWALLPRGGTKAAGGGGSSGGVDTGKEQAHAAAAASSSSQAAGNGTRSRKAEATAASKGSSRSNGSKARDAASAGNSRQQHVDSSRAPKTAAVAPP